MKNTSRKQGRRIERYLIIILTILFLVGCQNDKTMKPIKETETTDKETETTDNVADNFFPEEFPEATVSDNIFIDTYVTQTFENGDYYLAVEKLEVFKQNPVEGVLVILLKT